MPGNAVNRFVVALDQFYKFARLSVQDVDSIPVSNRELLTIRTPGLLISPRHQPQFERRQFWLLR